MCCAAPKHSKPLLIARQIDTAAVGEECGGMTVNSVYVAPPSSCYFHSNANYLLGSSVKKIKRIKEAEARLTTSTDGDGNTTTSVDDKAADCETTKKASLQKTGRIQKRKPVQRAGAGSLLAKVKDEDSDQ